MKWPMDRGLGQEGAQMGCRQGRAGWEGKGGRRRVHAPPLCSERGLSPPVHPGQSPPSSLGHSTSQSLPGAAVTIWVMMARREKREDAQHWGCAASPPLGAQPPHQPGPLPQGCPCLPALGPREKLGTMIWWLAPFRLSPLALALPSSPAPFPLCCLRPLCCVFHSSQTGKRSRGHLVPLTHAYRIPRGWHSSPRSRVAAALLGLSDRG